MEFRFTPQQEDFREEVKAFLAENLPREWRGSQEEDSEEAFAFARDFNRKMAGKGWYAPAWPKEYGGGGLTLWEQMILREECAYAGAPEYCSPAIGFVGPTLILYGTPDQKAQHLPGIANVEVYWAQGYSEPNAGSDLASLTTRAVLDGNEFIVNGQKIWTSQGHRAQWMILVVRTDPDAPKHKGISYLLVDMRSPGVSVRPLVNLANGHTFNETFLEDVRVPKENLLGELNRGWYMAAATLDFERANSVRWVGFNRRYLESIEDWLKNTEQGQRRLAERPGIAGQLADLYTQVEVSRMLSYRIVSMLAAGLVPNYEASINKVFASELAQRVARFAVNTLGLYGQLTHEEASAPLGGRLEHFYLFSTGNTIAAGTSEIQRNIIATRGLGLPRD